MSSQFFDYNSTTPVAPEALEEMLPYFSNIFANPSGQTSEMSWQSQSAIKKAKNQISKLIGCESEEIYFTSGATESINWVFNEFIKSDKNILLSDIDHDASFEKVKKYSNRIFFKSKTDGSINEESFKSQLEKITTGSLITFILAHNELGTVLELSKFIKLAKQKELFTHVDATQALGKITVNFKELNTDFLSCSAHKFYGPKGTGALVINKNTIAGLAPLISGGGQQEGLRSGTLNTPLIIGFGKASEIAHKRLDSDKKHFLKLRSTFLNCLENINYTLNGSQEKFLPNTINISFTDWKSLAPLYLELLPFSVSQSSACSSEDNQKRILSNLDIPEAQTIRVSFGRGTTIESTTALAQKIQEVLQKA